MMKFECPHCAQNLEISDEWSGNSVDCPTCQNLLTVPALAVATPVREEAPRRPAVSPPPRIRRPAPGSYTPPKPPPSGGGGFRNFRLVLVLLAGAGFGYAMFKLKES